ncbi:hypothetical protein IPP75_02525 [Candidatus Saccharibacteria bacterium]|nr:MAG: hypothetical protein IPP75_02525 [Candidatus Saccharibacteria bacterium]
MSLFDDIKAKADINGDGKITAADLEGLKDGVNNGTLDQLKAKADGNGDGKLDLSDLKDLGGNAGGLLSGLKDKLFK